MLKTEDFESAAVAKPTALAYFGTDRRRRGYVGPVVEASQRQRAEGYKAPLQYRWRGGGGSAEEVAEASVWKATASPHPAESHSTGQDALKV